MSRIKIDDLDDGTSFGLSDEEKDETSVSVVGHSLHGVREFLEMAEFEKNGDEHGLCDRTAADGLDATIQRLAHLGSLAQAVQNCLGQLATEMRNHFKDEIAERGRAAREARRAAEAKAEAEGPASPEEIAEALGAVSGFGTTPYSGGN